MKLKKIAEIVSGSISGTPEIEIKGISPIENAGVGDLVFVLEDKYLTPALKSNASALIVSSLTKIIEKPSVLVKNPRLAMITLLPMFYPKPKVKPGIHKTAVIAYNAKIGKRVTVHPFVCVVENCEIGDDSVIHPSVTIYEQVKIGKRVIVHAGARIGVDGYGFVWNGSSYVKIPQTAGSVVIEDDVEIFGNVCIARGTLGETRIGAGTKIDCLTHIAHNCNIGKHCAITALVGFAGSVTFKNHVSVGGMAGFSGHITVGENSVIMAKSGVTKDIPPNSVVSGFPAVNHKEELEVQAHLRKLPELIKKLKNDRPRS